MTIRVLLCDDQALVRGGFRMILEARADLQVVGEAGTSRQASAWPGSPARCDLDGRPDANLNGWSSPPDPSASGSPARMLMLTTYDLDEYVYAADRPEPAGSCSRTSTSQLTKAIRVIAARATPCSRRR